MPDFQYQPPTGPLSGSEFERQTTRFFQQVQGAADAAQSTAIVAQNTANDALERAQASNLVDGKTTTEAGGVITAKDVAIGGDLGDLASARGQIGDYRTRLPVGTDLNDIISSGTYIVYSGNCTNMPMNGMDGYYVLRVFGDATNPNGAVQKIYSRMGTAGPEWSRRRIKRRHLAAVATTRSDKLYW